MTRRAVAVINKNRKERQIFPLDDVGDEVLCFGGSFVARLTEQGVVVGFVRDMLPKFFFVYERFTPKRVDASGYRDILLTGGVAQYAINREGSFPDEELEILVI